jgi:hypothetical protein
MELDFLLQPATSRTVSETAMISFEVISAFRGFENSPISFAYGSKKPGRQSTQKAFGVKLLIAFGKPAGQYSFSHAGAFGHPPPPLFSRGRRSGEFQQGG